MTDFSTLPYSSSSDIPTLSYIWSLKKPGTHFGRSLPVQSPYPPPPQALCLLFVRENVTILDSVREQLVTLKQGWVSYTSCVYWLCRFFERYCYFPVSVLTPCGRDWSFYMLAWINVSKQCKHKSCNVHVLLLICVFVFVLPSIIIFLIPNNFNNSLKKVLFIHPLFRRFGRMPVFRCLWSQSCL